MIARVKVLRIAHEDISIVSGEVFFAFVNLSAEPVKHTLRLLSVFHHSTNLYLA